MVESFHLIERICKQDLELQDAFLIAMQIWFCGCRKTIPGIFTAAAYRRRRLGGS